MTAGMSCTYEVFDASRGEGVWVKTVPHNDGTRPEAVVDEHTTLVALQHLVPHVPRVYELFVGDDDTAFSMERIEGADLDVRLGAPEPGTAALLAQLVRILELVHRSGIVHRDVKPAHVMVTLEHRVVLLGFELAVPVSGVRTPEETVVGTPAYMSPEVLRGEPATPATDFYAVDTMIFEALTGRLPFEGDVRHLLRCKLNEPAPAPSSFLPSVDADLDQLCVALLDRDPSRRPGAEEILRVLQPKVDT
jgi:serine/threonine protein kinase